MMRAGKLVSFRTFALRRIALADRKGDVRTSDWLLVQLAAVTRKARRGA